MLLNKLLRVKNNSVRIMSDKYDKFLIEFIEELCTHLNKNLKCDNNVCKSTIYDNEALVKVGLFGFFIRINNKDVVVAHVCSPSYEKRFELANPEVFNLIAKCIIEHPDNCKIWPV